MDRLETAVPIHAGERTGAIHNEAHDSAVSWATVFSGAVVAAALSVILLALGSGLGFATVSPWSATGSSLGTGAIVWLIVTQVLACAMGGYLAGRLRTRWVQVQTDEVFFRDAAHRFLVWAVALVISVSMLASAATSIDGGAVQAGTAGLAEGAVGIAGEAAAPIAGNANSSGIARGSDARRAPVSYSYYVDALFRSDTTPAAPAAPDTAAAGASNDTSARAEAARVFANGLAGNDFPAADHSYLAKRVAARTGVAPADAAKHMDDTIAQVRTAEADARQAADETRRKTAHGLLWVFVALLSGAFCASFAATIGGRQRDDLPL